MAKPIDAKYAGKCKWLECDVPVEPGDQIKWLGKGNGVMHWECAVECGADSVIIETKTDEATGETWTVEYNPPKPIGKNVKCDEGCGGTGLFVTGVNNGKVVSSGQPHFRCNGKGYQTDADRTRNYWYDVKGMKVSM